MATRVAVTRITIEYVSDGRPFTIVFNDPSQIDAIILGQPDRKRLQDKQNELAKATPPQARPVVDHAFDPLAVGPTLRLKNDSHPPLPISVSKGAGSSSTASLNADRSLWWHATSCAWFHPEGDQ